MPVSTCQTCARVMREKNDFPRGNFSSAFCTDCVDAKGTLKPKEVIRANMIRMRVKSRGLNEEEAAEAVDNLMKRLPAWNQMTKQTV
ncbi:putative AraC family transcriptional regulator [Candidatus Zixiibacteriota bacterium]|nr:putative AraC family transcriptional regulator [candidate division Zixibacteria bacterium]